jgi:transposase
MPNPYPMALRERVVRAYEGGTEPYDEVAVRFSVSVNTLVRWVQQWRATGRVAPKARAGGWRSPVDVAVLTALARERPDRTTDELTRAYNRRVPPAMRVHRSSILRALRRAKYVFKKNGRAQRNRTGPPSTPRDGPSDAGSAA